MSRTTAAPKKQALPKKEDNRLKIFKILPQILSEYSPPLAAVSDFEGRYELVSKKPNEFMGRKRPEMYFGAAIIQSNYVGLYLMHVYMQPKVLEKLGTELRKTLKGKSCFHIKTLDNNLIKQIEIAVKDGIDCYRKLGFI